MEFFSYVWIQSHLPASLHLEKAVLLVVGLFFFVITAINM